MVSNKPSKPAKEFNMKTIKKGQDKKTEYIIAKKNKWYKILEKIIKRRKRLFKKF